LWGRDTQMKESDSTAERKGGLQREADKNGGQELPKKQRLRNRKKNTSTLRGHRLAKVKTGKNLLCTLLVAEGGKISKTTKKGGLILTSGNTRPGGRAFCRSVGSLDDSKLDGAQYHRKFTLKRKKGGGTVHTLQGKRGGENLEEGEE